MRHSERRSMMWAAAALCALLLNSALWAETKIVNSTQSIGAKLSTLAPGDTLMIRAGTYRESLSLPGSGTAGKPIVLMAYPGEKPVIQSSSEILKLNKSYWIFDGLIFDHENASSDLMKISSSGTHNIIRNCEFRNGKRDAIDVGGGTDNVIENNIIHDFVWQAGSDAHGIVTSPGVARLKIRNNIIYNCGGDGIQLYASGSDPVSSYARDIEITGNKIYTELGSDSENALDFKGVDGAVVENNEMYGFENKAVVVQKGCRNLRFERNVIYDSQRGMEFRGENGKSQENIVVQRNIIHSIRQYYGVKFDWVDQVTFVNNTLAFIEPAAIRIEEEGVTNSLFANNLFYRCGKPSIKGTFDAQHSHNGWFQTSAGEVSGGNDISGSDPQFVNAAAFDFRLSEGSPAVDAGMNVGLPFRGAAPEIGAFELGDDPTPVQLVSFSARTEKSDVHLRWQTAGESKNFGFQVERSRNGRDFTSIGFVGAKSGGAQGNTYTYVDRELAPGRYLYRLRQLGLTGETQVFGAVQVYIATPENFLLEQNAPNPFSLSKPDGTRLAFFLPTPEQTEIRIYNILGQEIRRFDLGELPAGRHTLRWYGKGMRNENVAPGFYFYELRAGSQRLIRKLAAVK